MLVDKMEVDGQNRDGRPWTEVCVHRLMLRDVG
jgi:hypothetical protein